MEVYLERRDSDAERFIDVVHRIGVAAFKERVYAKTAEPRAQRERQLEAA
jgi:sulfite reductase (NADPH) hemoprotein beta-component